MNLTRRGFLKLVGAAPLVIAAPALCRLWVPEQSALVLPEEQEIVIPLAQASVNGDVVFGWITSADMRGLPPEDLHAWLAHDSMLFPDGAPIMLIDGATEYEADFPAWQATGYETYGNPRGSAGMRRQHRFAWRGSGSPLTEGDRFTLRAGWKNRDELLTRLTT
jgi:hypothetical protein